MSTEAKMEPKKRRRRSWPYWLAAVIALATGSAFALKPAKSEAIDNALIVNAKRENLAIEVLDVGRVEAFDEVEILSKVAGRVAQVHVQDGDAVKKGQLLITLDTRDFVRSVEREQALLANAEARTEFAKRNFERKRQLAREGLLTTLDLELAEKEARLMELDIRSGRVALASAQDRLRDASIRAPAAGTTIRRKIEPGEMVVPGVESTFDKRALMTIADLSRLIVRVELNQIDVSKVKLGHRVTATFDGLPNEHFDAHISEISPASTKTKELDVFPIKAELDRPDPRIKPGMTADVRIHIEEKPNVITLPLESVQREAGKVFVKRVIEKDKKQTTERVEVVLGTANDRFAEIVSGINEGERILLSPASSSQNEKAM